MKWPFVKRRNQSKHFQTLAKRLKQKRASTLAGFKSKHKELERWAKKKGIKAEEVATKGAKGLATGIATGAMVLSSGAASADRFLKQKNTENTAVIKELDEAKVKTKIQAREEISEEVKKALRGVNPYDENVVTSRLSRVLNIPVKAELSGIRLNTSYGIMGYESHLSRYPGDNLATHFHSDIEFSKYSKAGMAGGPGAWGYIAPSREALTAKDIEREKYYLVAQTWLSPNWGTAQVKQWFRHRKMVVVNPVNGRVVVGVLEDAGPEIATGRSFGGSPEVVDELDLLGGGSRVFMYFVDDPQDKVPLGRYGR